MSISTRNTFAPVYKEIADKRAHKLMPVRPTYKDPTPGIYRHHSGRIVHLLRVETLPTRQTRVAVYSADGSEHRLQRLPVAKFSEMLLIGGRAVKRFEPVTQQ